MWAALRWARSRPRRGAGPYEGPEGRERDFEIPPAVAAARTELGLVVVEPAVAVALGEEARVRADSSRPAPGPLGSIAPRTPARFEVTKTEAGEVRFRTTPRGPWLRDPGESARERGSASLAEEIASSEARTNRAVGHFQELVYAPSTNATKDSLYNLWLRICQKRSIEPLPLTPHTLITNCAVLREAGYRSVASYACEAKDRHTRAGFYWDQTLQSCLNDIRRAAKRAAGEVRRAEEVRPKYWQWLVTVYGWNPEESERSDMAPAEGVAMVMVGMAWLLREVEVSTLFIDQWTIGLDEFEKSASLFLPSSKVDQQGIGVKRTLTCRCRGLENFGCPFHTLRRAVNLQLMRLGFNNLKDVPIGHFPLFGQVQDPAQRADKASVIKEMQRLAKIVSLKHPEKPSFKVEEISGHTMRRSGIKELGRQGLGFASIQWLARHSSNTTLIYLGQAHEDSSQAQNTMRDAASIGEMLSSLVSRQNDMEKAWVQAEKQLKEELSKIADFDKIYPDRHQLRREMRLSMIPEVVLNLDSHTYHEVNKPSCFHADPTQWTTKCGWPWLKGGSNSKPIFEDVEVETAGFRACSKCYGERPMGLVPVS